MVTYVNDLRLSELATGEGSGTWGTTTNTNLELIGEALGYGTEQSFSSDADATTTIGDGVSDPARAMYFKVTSAGSLTATRTLTIAPNTVSRVMFIENATTGSQSIAISQGSGASVTILTGKTAVVYLDGAGATAAVVDAMSGVDPGVTDTLTEVLVAGNTSGGTNIELSTTDKVQFRDTGIYINSSVDGQLDIVADTEIQIAATTVDLNGNLDVSGTTVSAGKITADAGIDIDNINIDGTTIALSSGDLTLDVAGDIVLDAGGSEIRLSKAGTEFGKFATDIGTPSQFAISSSVLDGDIKLQGNDGGITITALTLDMSEAGAATFNNKVTATQYDISSASYDNRLIGVDGQGFFIYNSPDSRYDLQISDSGAVSFGGVVTANAGVVVDNFTLDGTTLALSSGDFTVDVAGDIILDADGDDIQLKAGAFHFASITKPASNGVEFRAIDSDRDMFFKGNDGGSEITALTLDMSNAGQAIFNKGASFADHVYLADNAKLTLGGGDDGTLYSDGTNIIQTATGNLTLDIAGGLAIDADSGQISISDGGTLKSLIDFTGNNVEIQSRVSDADLLFRGLDGASFITALTLDMSEAGAATFNSTVTANVARTSSSSAVVLTLKDNVTGTQTDGVYKAIRSESNGTSSVSEIRFIESDGTNNNTAIGFATAISAGAISEKMRIHPGGVVSFLSGIELGSGLDATAANTLEDYEEGTFSPTIVTSGSTVSYTSQLGSYTKIGRAVHFSFSLTLNVVTSEGSGTFELGGMPFASASTNINNNRYVCQTFGVDFDSSKYQFYAYTPSTSVSTLRVLYTTDNGVWTVATAATFAINNSDAIVICGTYFTD
jgi:hypothetical protein